MKTIAYTRTALKALGKLPATVREQLIEKIARYAQSGAGDVKRMRGENAARLRSGDYRLIFEETDTEILVVRIGHRRDIYE